MNYITRQHYIMAMKEARGMRAGPQDAEVAMFANKTRVLLVLPEDVLGQARVLAGRATAALKLPVSLQIVLRALIEEGLKRDGDRLSLPTSRIRPSRSAAFGVWGVEQGEPRADAGTSRPEARGRAATVSPIGGEIDGLREQSRNATVRRTGALRPAVFRR